MRAKVYVSDDKKEIRGNIHGIKRIDRTESGFILTFSNYDGAYRAAQVLMNSGYETVKVLGRSEV